MEAKSIPEGVLKRVGAELPCTGLCNCSGLCEREKATPSLMKTLGVRLNLKPVDIISPSYHHNIAFL